jgi:hypothetical protein
MGRENYESNRKYHDLSKAEKERLNRAAGRRERIEAMSIFTKK